MSIATFAGMVTGVIVAVGLIMGYGRAERRRNPEAEDERMALVKAQAGSAALQIVGALAFVGWVADNLLAWSRGEAIQTITPWSIMLLAIVAIYDLSMVYFLRKYSAGGGEEVTRKDIAGAVLAGAAAIFVLAPRIIHGETGGDPGLYWLMIGLVIVSGASVLWMLFKARRSLRNSGGREA